jgi:CheY-like chemotaxis protein
LEKKKVLVVDDSILVRYVVCDELGKLGYEAITANNSSKAIKISKAQKPALILP